MLSIVDNDELAPTAAQVRQRLAAVLERAAEERLARSEAA
jgi:hypothetical protein